MLNAIKRWISGTPAGPDWSEVADWAKQQGFGFKRAKEGEGFVLDGLFGDKPWRLEWGPPQRNYIQGRELRIRMELRLPSHLQMLVMSRSLMEILEKETFERFTEGNQTVIDFSTPEEMRWLAMFPKASLDVPKNVKSSFGAVASEPELAAHWVDAPFAEQLAQCCTNLLAEQPPFVLMTLRGRLYMRLQMLVPEVRPIGQAIRLFHVAAQSAQRVPGGLHEGQAVDWPTTASTAWQTDVMPEDPKGPR